MDEQRGATEEIYRDVRGEQYAWRGCRTGGPQRLDGSRSVQLVNSFCTPHPCHVCLCRISSFFMQFFSRVLLFPSSMLINQNFVHIYNSSTPNTRSNSFLKTSLSSYIKLISSSSPSPISAFLTFTGNRSPQKLNPTNKNAIATIATPAPA